MTACPQSLKTRCLKMHLNWAGFFGLGMLRLNRIRSYSGLLPLLLLPCICDLAADC